MKIYLQDYAWRLLISFLSYLNVGFVGSIILTSLSWTPLTTVLPAFVYGLEFSLTVWVFGVWLLVGLVPANYQTGHRMMTSLVGFVHGATVMSLAYYYVAGRVPTSHAHSFPVLLCLYATIMGVASGLAAGMYVLLLQRRTWRSALGS